MANQTDFYTKLHRSMFRRINEVGAKPFLLFQYYLTYATAERIKPSLKTIALDMGILDKFGKPQISAVCHLKKELIDVGWIEERNGEIFITIPLEKVEKISTNEADLSDEKLRKSQQPIEKISTKVEKISTNEADLPDEKLRKSQEVVEKFSIKVEKISINSLENLNSPYIRIENEQENKQEGTIEDVKSSPAPAQEPARDFAETKSLVDEKFKQEMDETLDWILHRKNISKRNLPIHEWVQLFEDLEAEQITLDGFKKFYCWCESQDWVMRWKIAISPKVIRGQIESYKNREHFEMREKLANTGVKHNGTSTANALSALERREQSKLEEINGIERVRNRVEGRRKAELSRGGFDGG